MDHRAKVGPQSNPADLPVRGPEPSIPLRQVLATNRTRP
jgi:hypothetical protein